MTVASEQRTDEVGTKKDRWLGRTVADKFRIDSLIGEGAMGRVYRAEQVALDKPVAVKVLHRHLGGDERIARRFHREARAASRLSHPNSLSILDFGDAGDGDLYIAMELLEGDDLQAIIDTDAPLSPARIGNLMEQLLRALGEAHHAGIIHRDLKPENVVVLEGREGEELVKVCDFGIAKIVEPEGRSTAITKDGYVCGTPEYMAPEQARGEPVTPQSDLYSVGTVLYQMLCGRVPFKAENALGVITRHLMEEPPPPRSVQPTWGIPKSLEAVALKALSKDPSDRHASAKEMADAIRAAVAELGDDAEERLGHGVFETEPPGEEQDAEADIGTSSTQERAVTAPPVARGNAWLYGLAGALVVLAFGIWLWARPPSQPSPDPSIATGPPDPTTEPTPEPTPEPTVEPPPTPNTTPEPTVEPEPPEPVAPSPSDPTSRRARRGPTEAPEPDDTSPGRQALEAGRAAMLGGDLSTAVTELERAGEMMPRSAEVQKRLGQVYMRTGQVSAGIAAYRRYLELAPTAADRAIIERIIAQHEG